MYWYLDNLIVNIAKTQVLTALIMYTNPNIKYKISIISSSQQLRKHGNGLSPSQLGLFWFISAGFL